MTTSSGTAATWPGRRLGLPDEGPRSVARPGRRILAIIVDWAIASLIAWAFLPHSNGGVDPGWTLGVFAVLQVLFQLVLAGSPWHLALGLRVVPIRPAPLGLWRPVVRTVLLCLVIPALISDQDQRGLHDRVAGTVLVRR